MDKNLIKSLLILFLSMLFLASCAGSREEGDDYLTEDEKQQKELDDIEALLGISPDNQTEQAQQNNDAEQPKENDAASGEKLDLLDTNEMINSSPPAQANNKELENKINNLENQIRDKDRTIADLNAQITMQQERLNKQPASGGGTSPIVSDISMEEYQMRYEDGRAQFEARNYQAAIQMFESLLAASSSHSLADNAQFWIGECHYALRQYDAAIIDFEKVFTFHNSNKADASQFKLGLCYIRKGDNAKAREELNRLIQNYPNSVYVGKAEKLLGQN